MHSSYTNILELPIIIILFFFQLGNDAFLSVKNLPNLAQILYVKLPLSLKFITNQLHLQQLHNFHQNLGLIEQEFTCIHTHLAVKNSELHQSVFLKNYKTISPLSSKIFGSNDVTLHNIKLSSTNNPDSVF